MTPIRVLVADDQLVVRAGFVAVIDAEDDMTVVGEAGDGASAVRAAGELAPDVVVMDVRMPDMDGITATRLLTADGDLPRVLVLTTFDLDAYVFDSLRAGASGFLLKDASAEALVDAVRVVASGDGILSPPVTRRLIHSYAASGHGARDGDEVLSQLTPRERHVLTLIASGMTNGEIAESLGVSTGTVKTHVNSLFTKLKLRDRVQATILAYDIGLALPGGGDQGTRPTHTPRGGPPTGTCATAQRDDDR